MALPKKWLREQLQEAGCDEAKIDALTAQILDKHTSSLDLVRENYGDYDAIKTERDELKSRLEKFGDPEKLKTDFDSYKKTVETEKANAGKDKAVRKMLEDSGVARAEFRDLLMAQIDLGKIELDGETIKDSDKLIADLKTRYAGCFAQTQTQGAPNIQPPAGNGSGTGKTRAEIMAIKDTSERQRAIAENISLFRN